MDSQAVINYLQPLFHLLGNHPYIKSILVLFLAIAMANLIAIILTRVLKQLVKKTKNTFDDKLVAIIHQPLFWTVILLGSHTSVALLEINAAYVVYIHSIINTLLIFLWARFFLLLLHSILMSLSLHAKENSIIRPQTRPLLNNLSTLAFVVFGLYFIFQAWDIDMTAWMASAGVLGIAIGFAAKDTLANLFSGAFILADAPYKIGDYVVLENGDRGKVTQIGIRSTRLLTRDDVEVTIPNAIMGNTRIINQSGGPYKKFRICVKVGVAYGSDIDKVRSLLLEVAEQETQVCRYPQARVRFRSFGDSSLDFELLCWVNDPEYRGLVIDALNCNIYKSFMLEDIEIPYTKYDMYIKEMPDKH